MDKPIGVALIGCGVIAPAHLKALATMDDVSIRVLCDIVPERAEQYARMYGADVLTDYKEAVTHDAVDVVEICTPHHMHADIILAALDTGKYVLCEKPMAITLQDAQKLIDRANGRLGFVYQNRYNVSVALAKKMIDNMELGAMKTLRAFVCWERDAAYYATDAWRGTWEMEGGGSLINQAIHTVDLLHYLAGPIVSVKGSYTTDLLQGIVEVDENTHAVLKFQSGITGLLHTSNSYGISEPPEISIAFERGILRMYGDTLTISSQDTNGQLVSQPVTAESGKAVYGSGHMRLIPDFYRCIREHVPFWIDAQEAYQSLWTVLSIYESSRTNAWVSRNVNNL